MFWLFGITGFYEGYKWCHKKYVSGGKNCFLKTAIKKFDVNNGFTR